MQESEYIELVGLALSHFSKDPTKHLVNSAVFRPSKKAK